MQQIFVHNYGSFHVRNFKMSEVQVYTQKLITSTPSFIEMMHYCV